MNRRTFLYIFGVVAPFMAAFNFTSAVQAEPVTATVDPFIAAVENGTAPTFEEEITAAKKSMMGAPNDALAAARRAEAFALKKQIKDNKQAALATSLWLQAEALTRLNRPEEAAPLIDKAMVRLDDRNTQLGGDLLLSKGRLSRVLGRDDEALASFQSAFKIFEEIDSNRSQAIALQSIGTLYDDAHQYDRVIEYYAKASEVFSDDAMLDLVSLNNRANAHRELQNFEGAHKLSRQALDMAVDSGSDMLQARILTNIAVLETRAGNYEDAETAIEEGMEKIKGADAKGWAPFLWGARAELEYNKGNLFTAEKAIEQTFTGLTLSETTAPFRDFHETAYAVYRDLRKSDLALQHLQSFKRLDDQGRDVAASANLAILNAEFEFANKELEIEKLRIGRLESDIALASARERQQVIVLFGVSFISLGAVLFLTWKNLVARKTQMVTAALNKKLETKNAELAETNIRLDKANQAKTEFLATTSHEIRTPLNAIIGLSDVVLNGDSIIERDREYLEMVNNSGKHLLEIVNDILDVSKLEAGKIIIEKNPFDVAGCILNVAEIWRKTIEEKGLNVSIDIDPAAKTYMGDGRLLRQVVSNLISNAAKFTSEGEIAISLRTIDDYGFAVAVSDTGIGIAADQHRVIFEPFCQADGSLQRKYEGAGLGLAICSRIVTALGGGIAIESKPVEGSTFTVSIPAERAEAAGDHERCKQPSSQTSAKRNTADYRHLENIRVLIAEDNATNAMVIRALLQNHVGHIDIVANGAEALKILKKREFDIILLDKQMPIMDGVETTKAIRSLPPPVGVLPIVAVTADAVVGSRDRLLRQGMDDYVSKPLNEEELCRVIDRCLQRKKASAA